MRVPVLCLLTLTACAHQSPRERARAEQTIAQVDAPLPTPSASNATTLLPNFSARSVKLVISGSPSGAAFTSAARRLVTEQLEKAGAILTSDSPNTLEVGVDQVSSRYVASTPSTCVSIHGRLIGAQSAFLPGQVQIERCEGGKTPGSPWASGGGPVLMAFDAAAQVAMDAINPPVEPEASIAFRRATADTLIQLNQRARSYRW